jgi:pimeloyl-ACP methyl ester carboxylesterase
VFAKFWDLLKQVRTGSNPLRPLRGNPSQYPNERPEKVAAIFQRALQTQGDWDWREDARRVTSPALYVFGTADFMPLEAAQEWTQHLPNCQLLTLDNVGHFPSLEVPEQFFPALGAFLRLQSLDSH